MSDNEINKRIAELCGKWRRVMTDEAYNTALRKWKTEADFDGPDFLITLPKLYDGRIDDYCTDLNAMHEAENTLTDVQYRDYIPEITISTKAISHRQQISATARQRAEAFLRTMGKWDE